MQRIFLALYLILCSSLIHSQPQLWLTQADRSILFKKAPITTQTAASIKTIIEVNEKHRYQSIDGFGFALTGGSAMHLIRMNKESRAAILKDLFAIDSNNIGVSYLRVSIGASDLNEHVFSYDDLKEGETDPQLKKFDLGPDKSDVIPVLKEILSINPSIKILASPWSPPAWMKTNNDSRGGRLKEECYSVYANYLIRYIKEMNTNGIKIDAITIQNEPLHPGNNPSLLMPAPDQGIFIKDYFGPALKKTNLRTKIILYDHNADRPDYPISIMNNPDVKKYVDGSGFHLYGGKMDALTDVHNAHPDKALYFTEQMVVQDNNAASLNVASQVKRLIIGATRNWSRNVLLWNLAADRENKPFTDRGGCSMCQGAITIDKNDVSRNLAYYVIAHASKFVRPGSVRIESTESTILPNVAFQTPHGKKILIIVNDSNQVQDFSISNNGSLTSASLNPRAVGTFTW